MHVRGWLACAVFAGLSAAGAHAASTPYTLDFETEDDFTTPLVNGQDISTPPEFGNLVNVSSVGGIGAAIFDSTPFGPNFGGDDPDLLVGLGNILIIQNNNFPAQSTAGIFNTPNDDEDGGSLIFDFLSAVTLSSIDLIDMNGNGPGTVYLLDGNGKTRTYNVPMHWTHDITVGGPNGYGTLDLTSLTPQLGEGGGSTSASEDAGFDPSNVVKLTVAFTGSAGLDNIVVIPEPASAMLLVLGLAPLLRRRS